MNSVTLHIRVSWGAIFEKLIISPHPQISDCFWFGVSCALVVLKALQVLLMCSQGWELGEKTTPKSRLGRDLIVWDRRATESWHCCPRSALNGRKLRSRPQTRGSRHGQDPVSFSCPFLPPYCLLAVITSTLVGELGTRVYACVWFVSPLSFLFI